MSDTKIIEYDEITSEFINTLVVKLRKHSVPIPFLEYWVPDSDPIISLTNMVHAAQITGEKNISIRVLTKTLSDELLPKLQESLGKFGTVDIETNTSHHLIHVREIKALSGDWNAELSETGPTQAEWSPEEISASDDKKETQAEDAPEISGDETTFGDVLPVFRQRMMELADDNDFEGALSEEKGMELLRLEDDGIVLFVLVDPSDHVVKNMSYQGTEKPSDRVIFNSFACLSIGRPIQDVCDHSGQRLVLDLMTREAKVPVEGVMLPPMAGKGFMKPIKMIRTLRQDYADRTGHTDFENSFQPSPSENWVNLGKDEKISALSDLIAAFMKSSGLPDGSLAITDLDSNAYNENIRVIIAYSKELPDSSVPRILRKLEVEFRQKFEDKLEIVSTRDLDENPLRRLSS